MPRRKSGRFSLLRCLYYAIDFWVGTWWRDKRASAKLQAVLYDRHALDMCVDPQRYGIARMPQWLMRWLPQPDLLIVLSDTPARIADRKAELDKAEIQRQLAEWRELHRTGHVHHVIETTVPPDEIAAKILRLIVAFMLTSSIPRTNAANKNVLNSKPSRRAIAALNRNCVAEEIA